MIYIAGTLAHASPRLAFKKIKDHSTDSSKFRIMDALAHATADLVIHKKRFFSWLPGSVYKGGTVFAFQTVALRSTQVTGLVYYPNEYGMVVSTDKRQRLSVINQARVVASTTSTSNG